MLTTDNFLFYTINISLNLQKNVKLAKLLTHSQMFEGNPLYDDYASQFAIYMLYHQINHENI